MFFASYRTIVRRLVKISFRSRQRKERDRETWAEKSGIITLDRSKPIHRPGNFLAIERTRLPALLTFLSVLLEQDYLTKYYHRTLLRNMLAGIKGWKINRRINRRIRAVEVNLKIIYFYRKFHQNYQGIEGYAKKFTRRNENPICNFSFDPIVIWFRRTWAIFLLVIGAKLDLLSSIPRYEATSWQGTRGFRFVPPTEKQ